MKTEIVKALIKILFSCLISITSVCAQNQLQDKLYHVDIEKNIKNIRSVNLSSIGKEVSYIPLETTSECLIQKIYKVEFSESYIFIRDYEKLLQFDKNGKFIRQIGSSGRGPQEYSYFRDFCINPQQEEIYMICNYPSRLVIHDFNGVFMGSIKLSFKPAKIILKDNHDLMYYLWNHPGQVNPSWVITNLTGIVATSFKNSLLRSNIPGFGVSSTPLYKFKKSIHFMEFGIDTLYYFKDNDNDKTPLAIISLGNLKLEPDIKLTPGAKLIEKLRISSIHENNEYMFIWLGKGVTDGRMCAIFNKTNGSVTFLKDNLFINDLDGGPGFWPRQIFDDSILVDYIDAFNLLKENPGALKRKENYATIKLNNLKKQLTETSNPVIMLVRSNN